MLDIPKLQREIMANKAAKGFNVKDVNLEFCFLADELAEAHQAYIKKLPDLGEELADVAIYLLGLASILGIDLETELSAKVAKNNNREYKEVNGVKVRVKEG